MKIFKIKLHSSVDLITNSSTVIFTYSEGSLSAVKELVNEMLKVFDREETFDDLFYAEVFCEEGCTYLYFDDARVVDLTEEKLEEIKLQVLKGEIAKPDWMIDAEKDETHCEYYAPSTVLELLVKDEKYSELANKLLKYLYSTSHEATYNG